MTETITYNGQVYNIADLVPPPPGIPPDAMGPALTWIEQLLSVLQLASNGGDPMDIAAGMEDYANRQALTKGALAGFPENEVQGQAKVEEVSKMVEQIPQLASGLAGGLAGAIGGALKPLTEMPQQMAQSIQGFLQQAGDATDLAAQDIPEDALDAAALDEFGGGAGELAAESGGSGGGGTGVGTAPMSLLGPAPTPNGATTPTSSRSVVSPAVAATAAPHPVAGGPMGGYPMMPPGAMHGAGASDKNDKTATKKVSVPSVKNGAPVQGRVSVPPTGPTISKQVEGKTVATRRIVIPNDKTEDDSPR